jgi:hypothetical protein
MLKFRVSEESRPAASWQVSSGYLVGSDGNPVRSEIGFVDGLICCTNRDTGTVAVVLQTDVDQCGRLLLQTCLLPDREEPYLLNLELARHRIMVLYNKLEDWGMFDMPADHPITRGVEESRKLFIDATCAQGDDPLKADQLAASALVVATRTSEALSLGHADLLLDRRKSTESLPLHPFGCGVALDETYERVRAGMIANFDFIQLPICWRQLAPEEGEYRWEPLDQWARWIQRHKIPVVAGPLVSFEPGVVPDWLFIWEHDYENVRDLVYEYVEEAVKRYRHIVSTWNVVSGLHVNDHFTFGFEQIMDLTRMASLLVKDLHPGAKVLVELCQPFGEYAGQNQRSIPPLTYADLLVQGAVSFDGFALKLLMGQAAPGRHTRDLMQISNLLDQFGQFGKSLHLTIGAPSEPVAAYARRPSSKSDQADQSDSGYWRAPWSASIQGRWMEAVMKIALSKPFVESVAWLALVDDVAGEIPSGGLVAQNLQPKGSFKRLVACRRSLMEPDAAPTAAAAPNGPS